jgi:hypothetical protein
MPSLNENIGYGHIRTFDSQARQTPRQSAVTRYNNHNFLVGFVSLVIVIRVENHVDRCTEKTTMNRSMTERILHAIFYLRFEVPYDVRSGTVTIFSFGVPAIPPSAFLFGLHFRRYRHNAGG